MFELSVIIPCFHNNLKNFVNSQKCLQRLKETTNISYELIIVENIERWLIDEGDIYLGFRQKRTYAENFNSGLKFATGDYICSLSNDLLLPDSWVEAIMECFRIPDCGIATIESSQYNRPAKDEIIELFFGGVWVAKKEVVNKVGLLDESFRHAFDDADYWIRTYQAGYKIYMNRRVMVEHKPGLTLYDFEGHNENYVAMREKFYEKHKDCGLPIFERLK